NVETANILRLLPRAGLPVFGDYLVLNRQPTPNWLGHLALTALIRAFGPFAAEKILVTAYIVGLPLAVAYAFAALRRGSAPLAVLSFPFLFHCLLPYGLSHFCLT